MGACDLVSGPQPGDQFVAIEGEVGVGTPTVIDVVRQDVDPELIPNRTGQSGVALCYHTYRHLHPPLASRAKNATISENPLIIGKIATPTA